MAFGFDGVVQASKSNWGGTPTKNGTPRPPLRNLKRDKRNNDTTCCSHPTENITNEEQVNYLGRLLVEDCCVSLAKGGNISNKTVRRLDCLVFRAHAQFLLITTVKFCLRPSFRSQFQLSWCYFVMNISDESTFISSD